MGPQIHAVIIYKRWGERTESPFVTLLPSGAEEQKGQHAGVGAKAWPGCACLWAESLWGVQEKFLEGEQGLARAVHGQAGKPEGETKMCHHVS